MKRIALLISLAAAACHSGPGSEPAPQSSNTSTSTPSPDPAPPSDPVDCGFIDATIHGRAPGEPQAEQCFADAFRAGRSATVKLTSVTDEAGKIYTTFRAIPGDSSTELEVTVDDRDDGYGAAPGIHVFHCTAPRIERQPDGHEAVIPDGCH